MHKGANNGEGKRKRKRDEGFAGLADDSAPLMSLGVGAAGGCTECVWFVCKPDDTPAGIAVLHNCKVNETLRWQNKTALHRTSPHSCLALTSPSPHPRLTRPPHLLNLFPPRLSVV